MRTENVDDLVELLKHEIQLQSENSSEAAQRKLPLKRGKLEQAIYERFSALENPTQAMWGFHQCHEIGNLMAITRLLEEAREKSLANDQALNIEKNLSAEELFIRGLQALAGIGVSQNDFQALEYFKFAAELGLARAQSGLGWMYFNGVGVVRDYAEAFEWYRRSAEQGDVWAQLNLGWRYEFGEGVAQDDAQAVEWFRRAAEQGEARAQFKLGWLYENNRVPIHSQNILEYRKDIQKRNIYQARGALYALAERDDFQAHYHLAMVAPRSEPDPLLELSRTYPNHFFKELMTDPFLEEEARFQWLERLFEEHFRSKKFLERAVNFENRSKLTDENAANVCMEVAKYHYARLSQMSKGHNSLENPVDGETKRPVDLTKIPEAKQKIEKLLKILSLIPDHHAHFAEAQLISAHLNFMQNRSEWRMNLKACADADFESKWMNFEIIKQSIYQNHLQTLQGYHRAKDKVNSKEILKEFRQKELSKVSENPRNFLALLRLSIMTQKREKRQNYLVSLRALDDNNFSNSRSYLNHLEKFNAIDKKDREEMVKEMDILCKK